MNKALSNTETVKILDKALSGVLTNTPSFLVVIAFIFFAIAAYMFILSPVLKRLPRTRKWFDKKDERVKEIEDKHNEALVDSKQKSVIITLSDQLNKEIRRLIRCYDKEKYEQFNVEFRKVVKMIVQQIPAIISNRKDVFNRCAVLTPDPEYREVQLKILEGSGYSPEGTEKLRLSIDNSFAGKVYKSGGHIYSKNITQSDIFKI